MSIEDQYPWLANMDWQPPTFYAAPQPATVTLTLSEEQLTSLILGLSMNGMQPTVQRMLEALEETRRQVQAMAAVIEGLQARVTRLEHEALP
jgi:hypothetical protein